MAQTSKDSLVELISLLLNKKNLQSTGLPDVNSSNNSDLNDSKRKVAPSVEPPQNLSVRPGPPYGSSGVNPTASSAGGHGTFSALLESMFQRPGDGPNASTADIVISGSVSPPPQKKPVNVQRPAGILATSIKRPGKKNTLPGVNSSARYNLNVMIL
jgi:hypothetical protein